jgi:hypothetical protein
MSRVRRIFSVVTQGKTYLSLAYVVLRLPLALVYAGILGFVFFRGVQTLWSLVLFVPAGMAIWGGVVVERAMAQKWFGARLTPISPERPADRTWRQRAIDLISNPVTWKSLAFVVMESILGFVVGLAAVLGFLLGVVGSLGLLLTALVSVLVAVLVGDSANVPGLLPVASLGGAVVAAGILLFTLHASRWTARLQVWFVRVMLGMSETQAALAEARQEAAQERTRAEVADRSRRTRQTSS